MKYKDISLRKKILLSNLLMVLVPILFLCLILFLILAGFTLFTSNSSISIRNVLLNSSNYGPTLLIKQLNDEIANDENLNDTVFSILHNLEDIGIKLQINKNHKQWYVSKPYTKEDIQQEFQDIAQTTHYEAPYIIWNQNGMAYATQLVNKKGETIQIQFAGKDLELPKGSYESWEQTKLILKIGIVSGGTIIIFIIVLLGTILTKKLSRHILQPLHQLQLATNEIRLGDLTTPLYSDSKDEIGELFSNFENMREELGNSKKLQERYETNRKELIAGISHDLNTPLTSIQGYVNGLLDGIANTPEKQAHYLETIRDQTQKMGELVDSLFLFSKLDLQKEPFENISLDFKDFLYEWVCEHQTMYLEQHLKLTFQCHDKERLNVQLDPMLFHRVLVNLLNNSLKYKKNNTVHVTLTLQKLQRSCQLDIQDDGIGVSPGEAQRLFDSFYRSDPARSSAIKGNGLGLAIAQRIIQTANGTIQAIQEEGQGLCLRIILPLEDKS